jgi:hypothetical protein
MTTSVSTPFIRPQAMACTTAQPNNPQPINAYPAFKFSNNRPHERRYNPERGRRRTSKDLRAMGTGASRTLGKISRMKALVLSASASRSTRIVPLLSIFITP